MPNYDATVVCHHNIRVSGLFWWPAVCHHNIWVSGLFWWPAVCHPNIWVSGLFWWPLVCHHNKRGLSGWPAVCHHNIRGLFWIKHTVRGLFWETFTILLQHMKSCLEDLQLFNPHSPHPTPRDGRWCKTRNAGNFLWEIRANMGKTQIRLKKAHSREKQRHFRDARPINQLTVIIWETGDNNNNNKIIIVYSSTTFENTIVNV